MISCPRFYSFLFLQFSSLLPVYEFQNLIRRRSPEDNHEAFKYVPTASYKIQQKQRTLMRNADLNAFIGLLIVLQIFMMNSFHAHKVVPEVIDLLIRRKSISDPYFSIWSSSSRGEFSTG
jgi:hypothetical protein